MTTELSYSEKRRNQFRSRRYIMPTLQETRKKNNQPIIEEETIKRSLGTQQGKFLSEALRIYIAGDEEKFSKYSDRTQKLVKKMYENSLENNSQAQELWNRTEGKVRDEIHIDHTISSHIPDQDSRELIEDRYRAKLADQGNVLKIEQ